MKHAIPRSLPQIIIVIVIVAIGISIVSNQLGISFAGKSSSASTGAPPQGGTPGQPARTGGGGKRTFAVRANTINIGSVSNYTKIHGDAVSNNEIKIYPNVGGKLLERQVSVGDRVVKGTTIALVDPSKVGETFMPNPIESTVSGTVLSIPVQAGDTITANTVIATVGDLSRTRINTAVPERYLTNLRIGTPAEISFDAIPGMTFAAKVAEMSPIVDVTSRTLTVKLELERADPRVLVGMFATVKLATESRKNVIVTPRSSVILGSNEAYVFIIKGDNTVERRRIILGLEGEDSFEVKKGLAPGENVVTEGKSSIANGDSVKIVNGETGNEAGVAK
jgi:membrane fusion protein (multidrug efflux system)